MNKIPTNENFLSSSLQEIGETKLIRYLSDLLDKSDILDQNEDAIAFQWDNSTLVANTDSISWNSDVLPGMSSRQIGKKVVSVTVSDLAAKGALPKIFFSSISLPATTAVEILLDIVKGMKEEANSYGIKYLGGDLGKAEEGVIVGIVLGSISKEKILKRNGAKQGDFICVTGTFGHTGVVLNHFYKNKDFYGLKTEWIQYLKEPKAKIKEGLLLSDSGFVTACIDSSDGLARCLYEISEQSHKKIIINSLPINTSIQEYIELNNLNLYELIFFGGEEYELVFCVNPESFVTLEEKLKANGTKIYKIGYVGAEGVGVHLEHGHIRREIPQEGWWDSYKN